VENDLLTTRNKLTNALAASAEGDASARIVAQLKETEVSEWLQSIRNQQELSRIKTR
jgi:hypothetical protein